MEPKIIYEDDNIIVVDKPAGLSTHAANENDKRETLVSFLISHYPDIKNIGDVGSRTSHIRPGIVHRLDKETSGLMVIAKNNEAFYELKQQFLERKVEKKYIALVSGQMEKDSGVINRPLIKMGTKTITYDLPRPSQAPGKGGRFKDKLKPAITEYKALKRFGEYTLVEIMPKTGRMHQIRAHFASINHPVSCDKIYGRKSKKCPAGLNRHFLHASGLKFVLKNGLMDFESKLPEDLESALLNLKS